MKLVDIERQRNVSKCEHCIWDGRSGCGVPILWCALRAKNEGYANGIVAGASEPCTPEDWAICPLNKEKAT